MTTLILLVLSVVVLFTAAGWVSCRLARRLEARYPPRGVFINANGVRMHALDLSPARPAASGQPTVLLLHGANLCCEDMRMSLGERLAQRLRVIVPDRPGQGYSVTGTGPVASPAYQVTLIREVLRDRDAGPLIVVGHSFGGLIALRYALDNPDTVAGLVLINPTTHPRPQGLPLFQRAAEVLMKPLVTYTLLPRDPCQRPAPRWCAGTEPAGGRWHRDAHRSQPRPGQHDNDRWLQGDADVPGQRQVRHHPHRPRPFRRTVAGVQGLD